MMTWTVIAVPWNPSNQGETNVHIPTIRLSHSSQIANAASGQIVARGSTVMVSYDYASSSSTPLPDATRSLLDGLRRR